MRQSIVGSGGFRTTRVPRRTRSCSTNWRQTEQWRHFVVEGLACSANPVVRAWAGTAAARILGHGAVPLLRQLKEDTDPDVRDIAHQDLIALDPKSESQFLPLMRQVLARRAEPWGEDRAAMWRVARLRDADSVPILRDHAEHHEQHNYHYRMPMVLAAYIQDPSCIARRIAAHDHDWMFWLLDATNLMSIDDRQQAIDAALALALDGDCATLLRNRRRT